MTNIIELEKYCTEKNFDFKIDNDILELDSIFYKIIDEEDLLFNEDFKLVHNEKNEDKTNFVYKFGGRWYTQEGVCRETQLKELIYIGKSKQKIKTDSFLGIHSGGELLNGVGDYEKWIKKAKFLNIKNLGICEKNSLSGVVEFQTLCKNNEIKSIIGMSIEVENDEDKYEVKIYIKNNIGWQNALKISKTVNLNQKANVSENFLKKNREGLFLVIDSKYTKFKNRPTFIKYYQLDTVKFKNNNKDKEYLDNLEKYLKSELKPVAIFDAYNLESEDRWVREKLWKIAKIFDSETENQYFKNNDEYVEELSTLFEKENTSYIKLYKEASVNLQLIAENCNFIYDTSKRHLPKYQMTKKESEKFSTNKELFKYLLKVGFKSKNIQAEDYSRYIERLKLEIKILEDGNVIDYFLILYDIIKFAKEQGILVGIGRGSAGGSLVSYMLGIIQLDPLDFGLLFSRFLNKGRLDGGSLPDIDTDFESIRRSEIKDYIEERFGKNKVISVGMISSIQLKGGIKDLDRQYNSDFYTTNIITSMIQSKDITMLDLFKRSCKEPKIKEYIKHNSDIIYDLPSILNQPKSHSIHPCAIVLFPDKLDADELIPTRKHRETTVTQWTGNEMDKSGFLKADILGLLQLDKFSNILDLINKNNKEIPDIYGLKYDDVEVFRYFRNGWNSDIFQIGTLSLSKYTKEVKPHTIEDLIAIIALYRPGPIENKYHIIYTKCKNEGLSPKYLWKTEQITKSTYGLIVYQEQIMEICMKLGNLSEEDADNIRRAMGKKSLKVLEEWREVLKRGFLKNGATEEQFKESWDVMIKFSKYCFNKSHSAAYAITGYIAQYLKVKFPLEFWTISLGYVNEDDFIRYLSEIFSTGTIKISPPDINKSKTLMTSDVSSQTIFLGFESIKGVGEAAARQIEDIRIDGKYTGLEDFLYRNIFKGSKVNKRTVESLITVGAFDILYNLKDREDKRLSLIKSYRISRKVKIGNTKTDIFTIGNTKKRWWWILQQKILSGLAFVNFNKIAINNHISTQYVGNEELHQNQEKGIFRACGGYVTEKITRKSVNGLFAVLTIESNYKIFKLILWNDEYVYYKKTLEKIEKCFIIFDGLLKYESRYIKGNQWMLKSNSKFIKLV